MQIDRGALVRRLLGAATRHFLNDADPLVVCCLASAALEHAELLAIENGGQALKAHVLATFTTMSEAEFKKLRNKDWRVIKHSHNLKGIPFDVSKELAGFEDTVNDAILFTGWHDYQKSGRALPVEAQALQVWFFNMYPHSVDRKRRPIALVVWGCAQSEMTPA